MERGEGLLGEERVVLMADMQEFPENWEDFIKMHEFDDSAEVYTNGVMLVPSFRVGQMVEHYFKERTCCMTDRGECSECGAYIVRAWTEVHDFNGDMKRIDLRSHNYCPNCGAKVVKE